MSGLALGLLRTLQRYDKLDSNGIRTHKHLVHKRTLNHLAVSELSGCGFQSRCCHLNLKYVTCFGQGVP